MPILNIVVPGNITMVFGFIIPVVMFDVLENDKYNYQTLFDFDEQTDVTDQVSNLGYDSNSSLKNLGSIAIFIFLYFVKLILFFIIYKST